MRWNASSAKPSSLALDSYSLSHNPLIPPSPPLNIAYRNHLRGARSCVPAEGPAVLQQRSDSSRGQFPGSGKQRIASPRLQAGAGTEPGPEQGPQPGIKYYCKLCPNREIKNRVSLGCHLTIYHGLPQVSPAAR